MDAVTVRILCGVLAIVLLALIILRRRQRSAVVGTQASLDVLVKFGPPLRGGAVATLWFAHPNEGRGGGSGCGDEDLTPGPRGGDGAGEGSVRRLGVSIPGRLRLMFRYE